MPVIVLEAKDFASPLFLVRTWEVLSSCVTFSLVASLEVSELSKKDPPGLADTFRVFCMFIWCFFFTLTFLIHVLTVIQFHSLIPISWKNLTVTVAFLGALMCLSASVVFPWIVMAPRRLQPRPVAAVVASCLTFLAYGSESYILRTQSHEQRGYMGSMPGLLKILQLWGGFQMVVLVVNTLLNAPPPAHNWQLWVSSALYGVCVLTSVVTLVVILGDFAGRCLLPFDRLLAGFSLMGVLLYMVATVICFTQILQLNDFGTTKNVKTVIMETAVASITLLAYTVDLAFSIKQICDRNHT